jgi:hypothetical protein
MSPQKDSLSLNDPTSYTLEQIREVRGEGKSRFCDCHRLRFCPTEWMRRDKDADDWDRGKEHARQEKEERDESYKKAY